MKNPYRENENVMHPEIEERIARLEKKQELNHEAVLMRTIARCLCAFALAGLGTAYGCNREDNHAKVEAAKAEGAQCVAARAAAVSPK